MHIYDTLIIGSGYGAIGYAATNKNTIVCEEHQICDVGFHLPLRSFAYAPYEPKTAEGKALQSIFNDLSLFRGDEQNANGFEFALCKYVVEKSLKVLLKCRVIDVEKRADGLCDVTVQTNEGLSHIFAKKVLRATAEDLAQKKITVLFAADDFQAATDELISAFSGATVEKAFYEDRRALHIPLERLGERLDENTVKLAIYRKWQDLSANAKIIYIAPVFYGNVTENALCDMRYRNPVEAFENGCFCAEKEMR